MVKIATYAKPENVIANIKFQLYILNKLIINEEFEKSDTL